MPVLVEIEIQPVIKPRHHQSKEQRQQRRREADGRRKVHRRTVAHVRHKRERAS